MRTVQSITSLWINAALLALILLTADVCFAQDVITYKNGKEEKGKIIEISPTEIRFKKSDNPDGPTYYLDKSDIFMIQYENGSKDYFSDVPASTNSANNVAAPARIKYSGPRIGLTIIGHGMAAEFIRERGKVPFVTQFGWQFETRIFTLEDGTSGLFEFVPLVGGIEQGMFLPSISGLFGIRGKKGFEFAFGPNLSLSGFAMALAVGTSFRSGDVYFPVNLAVVPSISRKSYDYDQNYNSIEVTKHTGIRVSLTLGFNSRKK